MGEDDGTRLVNKIKGENSVISRRGKGDQNLVSQRRFLLLSPSCRSWKRGSIPCVARLVAPLRGCSTRPSRRGPTVRQAIHVLRELRGRCRRRLDESGACPGFESLDGELSVVALAHQSTVELAGYLVSAQYHLYAPRFPLC